MVLVEELLVEGTDVPVYHSTNREWTVLTARPDKSLMCPVCDDLLLEPMLSPCGHSVCSACLYNKTAHSGACFTCGAAVNVDDFYSDRVAVQQMASLECYCRWALAKRKQPDGSWKLAVRFGDAEACDAVVTLKDRERHETACGFKQVRCPLINDAEANDRCPEVCSRMQVEEHMQTCEYRRVPCFHTRSGCQWEGSLKLEEAHRKNCDYRPQPCKNGCGTLVRLQDVTAHAAKCTFGETRCGAADSENPDAKCDFACLRSEVPEHRTKCEFFQKRRCVFCDAQVSVRSVMLHNQTCGEVILNCDDCNAAVPRWKMEAHKTKECPNALRQCEFEFFGCSQWFKISQIKYHNEQANQVHMEMLAHAVKELVGQVGKLQTDVVALRSDVTSMQGELKGLGEGLKRQEALAAKEFKNVKTTAKETSQTQKTDMATLRDALQEQAQTFSTQMLNSYEESVRTSRALGEFRQSQLEFNSSHLEKSGQWMANIEQRLDAIAEDVSSKILSNYNTIVEGLRDEHNWVAGKLNDLQTELHTEVGNCQAATHAKVMNIFEHVQNIGRKYI